MNVLSLDPGKVTGWAVSCGDVGSFTTAHIDHGQRLSAWTSAVGYLFHDWDPGLVVWDQPFARGAEGALQVGIGKWLEMRCWQRETKRLMAPMSTVKKAVLGNGRATDRQAIEWAEHQGWKIANNHEADAVLLLSYALKEGYDQLARAHD